MLTDDLYLKILLSGFEDARDIAKVKRVCKGFNEAAKNVISIRYVCRENDHEKARRNKTIASMPSQRDKAEASERDLDDNILEDVTTQRDAEVSEIDDKDGKLPETINENGPGEFGDAIPGSKSIGAQRDEAEASKRDLDDNILEDVTTQGDAEVSEIDYKDGKPPEAINENGPGEFGDAIPGSKSIGAQRDKAEASKRDLDDNILEDVTTQGDAEVSEIDDKDGKLPETINEKGPGEFGDAIPGSKSIGELGDSVAAGQGQASSSQRNIIRFEPVLNSSYGKGENSKSSSNLVEGLPQELLFRQAVEQDLLTKSRVQQLRIEIEPKLQSKSVGADEREHTDFWLSDPVHLHIWVPSVAQTLQHLCIVDYGHQAIVRVSPILKILSHYCNHLKTIDLRNMFIDTNECTDMRELTSFTLRCVKINGDALNDFSDKMKNLQTLALLGVFGIDTGHLKLQQLKILCLGFSTKAKVVTMELPSLTKLQLKMACPEDMSITAPNLKYVAFNLEVPAVSSLEGVPGSLPLRFVNVKNLQELLYGASKFVALSDLVMGNQFLNKVFLDIPCMALGEDGKWLGVLKEVILNIPSFTTLQQQCPNLEVLNIGPGLWYAMEAKIETVKNVRRWPGVRTLILQMIPQKIETSAMVLETLVTAIDTLVNLEIFVHTSSPVQSGEFFEVIQNQVQHLNLNLKLKPWTKSLDFSCFTF